MIMTSFENTTLRKYYMPPKIDLALFTDSEFQVEKQTHFKSLWSSISIYGDIALGQRWLG